MGDMADFTNDMHEQECMDVIDYLNGEMDYEDAYDHGFLDHDADGLYEAVEDYMVDPWDLNGQLAVAEAQLIIARDRPNIRATRITSESTYQRIVPETGEIVPMSISDSEKTTLKFLHGFATFYLERGFLSDKQKAIVETNWKGGAERFIHMLDNDDTFMARLDFIVKQIRDQEGLDL